MILIKSILIYPDNMFYVFNKYIKLIGNNKVYFLREFSEEIITTPKNVNIIDSYHNIHFDEIILVYDNRIKKKNYIEIISFAKINNYKLKLEKELYESLNNDDKIDLDNTGFHDNVNKSSTQYLYNEIIPINIPVIMVLGMGHDLDKFEVQLDLKAYFEDKHYKALQFGTKEYSSIFNMFAMPNFLSDNPSLVSRIMMYNQYFYEKTLEEDYDVIIIGVPGAIMPFSEQYLLDFGEFASIITNAIIPDITILNLYYGDYSSEFLQELSELLKYKFNNSTKYFHLSNKSLEIKDNLNNEHYLLTYSLDDTYKMMKNIDVEFEVFNTNHSASKKEVFDSIYNELVNNPITPI